MTPRAAAVLTLLSLFGAAPCAALAQRAQAEPRLELMLGAGWGGARSRTPTTQETVSQMNVAPQVRAAFVAPLTDYFGLGAGAHLALWQSDLDEQRGNGDSTLLGLSALAELRTPPSARGLGYLRLGVGPMIDLLSTDPVLDGLQESADRALGLHVHGSAGALVFHTAGFGWMLAAAVDIDFFRHELDVEPDEGDPASYEMRFLLTSIGIAGGVFFQL